MSTARGLRGWWVLIIGFPLFALVAAVIGVLIGGQGGMAALSPPSARALVVASDPATLERGEYLARIGDCVTCHTRRGGEPLAGGRAFSTSFGVLYSGNLTPDADTGIGDWSVEQFRHALAHGVGRSGLLYPAFPFQNFQHLAVEDADAIFAWLMSRPAVVSETPANAMTGMAGWRPALIGWRMAFHRPWELPFDESRGPAWNRGRYLVEGLGHCSMCHGERGAYGAMNPARRFAGGRVLGQGWYAPALDDRTLAHWSVEDLAGYLRTGVAPQASAFGPMAEVIGSSLQYLSEADARAIAEYLLSLPELPQRPAPPQRPARDFVGPASTALYEKHCADCHGRDGQGRERVYPPLAGSAQVLARDPVNLMRITLFGATPPTTWGNPAPHSMPPFVDRVPETDLVMIFNHLRGSWGNDAGVVTLTQLRQARALPLE